jgi:hypothetical protein
VVYIREAHPVDGWDIGSENRVYDPETIEERRQVAGMCEVALQYGIRTYEDEDALNTYVCDGVDVSGNTSGRYLSRTI